MRKFTIGIPTFNRAGYLRRSLASALAQTLEDVEILVSDNASTDETAEVIRQAGPRVRYLRNDSNLGMWPNLLKLVESAEGEFFSFLQDDDLVHCDFARRAGDAFAGSDSVVVYAAYAAKTPSPTTFWFPTLYGPPFALDWTRGTGRLMDGKAVAPLSLFMSVAIPPAIAFRTEILRRAIKYCDPACELYDERILLAAAASEGTIAVDPFVAAVFLQHSEQAHQVVWRTDPSANHTQWLRMAHVMCAFLESWGDAWKGPLRGVFQEASEIHRREWLAQARAWKNAPRMTHQVVEILREGLNGSDEAPAHSLKDWARDLTPPILWRFMRWCIRRPS